MKNITTFSLKELPLILERVPAVNFAETSLTGPFVRKAATNHHQICVVLGRYTSASGTSIAQQVVILSLARPLFLMSPLQYGDL